LLLNKRWQFGALLLLNKQWRFGALELLNKQCHLEITYP
jgi:hypothetical protein